MAILSVKMKGHHRLKYWLTRLSLYGFTLVAMLAINFFLPRAMPGDPIQQLIDPQTSMVVMGDTTRAALSHYYGLDQPLWKQFLSYLANLMRGDLGWSISQDTPVSVLIAKKLPWTVLLMFPSILLAALISVLAGTASGWARGSRRDRALLITFMALDTLPIYLVGVLLIMLFTIQLGWLPLSGLRTAFREYHNFGEQAGDILVHLALPMATLTLGMAGRDYLLTRNSLISVLGEDFMLVARGKGLPEAALKYHHGMRNAVLPVFTRFIMSMGAAITGAVLVETLFAYPGMGQLMFNSVASRDYPVLQGCFLIAGLAMLLANLLADFSYYWLDPRTRETV